MDLIVLPPLSESALADRSVSPKVQLAVRLVVTCLREVCETVAEDTGGDRYDDATSEGQLRWRRCRNRVRHLLDDNLVPELDEAVADISDNALVIRVHDCSLSFYSARNGIDQPDLSGPSRTKGRVVTEMQLQIHGLDAPEPPSRLVIVYEADDDGLAKAAVGMLASPTEWHWQVLAHERADHTVTRDLGASLAPAYTDQPDVDLPAITPRKRHDDETVPAYDEQPDTELPTITALGDVGAAGKETGSGRAK
jgi:hypothetical protein